jgi:hypothetical protein
VADYNTEQRRNIRHKLLTRRGRTQESYMRTSRALMQEMVRLQREIRIHVHMLANSTDARDDKAGVLGLLPGGVR